jgi:threonine dehydrogenase-like Zn-dependent dehydrogenase
MGGRAFSVNALREEDMQAQALWSIGAGVAELRPEEVRPAAGEVVVRMLWSGISRGTERLVFEGRVPDSERARMRCPFQAGEFPFPVKYGYQAVGVVEDGPSGLLGRRVFCLHPHQSLFAVPRDAVHPLPDALPPRRAVLTANMETALNAVWDSGAGPGDRILVVGAGALGLLTASILARLPGACVTIADHIASRAEIAAQMGVMFASPGAISDDFDLSFHVSASAGGLRTALEALGPEGTCVEMSWHGSGDTPVPLGGAFHSRRLRLVSSQVGSLPPMRRPRWDYARRLATALDLLCDDRLDALITGEVAFADLPRAMPALLGPGAEGVATAVRY